MAFRRWHDLLANLLADFFQHPTLGCCHGFEDLAVLLGLNSGGFRCNLGGQEAAQKKPAGAMDGPAGVNPRQDVAQKKPAGAKDGPAGVKWRGQDSNLRPRGYEPRELPGCSTPRRW